MYCIPTISHFLASQLIKRNTKQANFTHHISHSSPSEADSDSPPKILYSRQMADSEKKQCQDLKTYFSLQLIDQIKSIPHMMWKKAQRAKLLFDTMIRWYLALFEWESDPWPKTHSLTTSKGFQCEEDVPLMEWQHPDESTNQSGERWETVGELFLHSAARVWFGLERARH